MRYILPVSVTIAHGFLGYVAGVLYLLAEHWINGANFPIAGAFRGGTF
jgi:hypothetical protein